MFREGAGVGRRPLGAAVEEDASGTVVVALASFKGSLGADAATAALPRGTTRHADQHTVLRAPVAVGGEGTLDAVVGAEVLDTVLSGAFSNWANRLMPALGEPPRSDRPSDSPASHRPAADTS